MIESRGESVLSQIWLALDGDPRLMDRVRIAGPGRLLPGPFDVTEFAAVTVAAATLAAAEFGAWRLGIEVPPVEVDRLHAAAAFRSESLLRPLGWDLPPVWDPIAGNYQAKDGWIRLHTNYAHHRAAALRALGFSVGPGPDAAVPDREQVAALVYPFAVDDLEQAVLAEGGCAAAWRPARDWAQHPHGRIAVAHRAVTLKRHPSHAGVPLPRTLPASGPDRAPGTVDFGAGPLTGIRVLDLTRVMAGPVTTRTLAAWGAEVIRIDPPGFAEVPALLPDMTAGKQCVALDLHAGKDRARFEALVAEADVLVQGLRPGALAALGYPDNALRRLNPTLAIAAVNAYGWAGPWSGRRGFDSLVQFSCGISATCAAAADGSDRPGALPAQALDHGTGYLLAAAICRGLTGQKHHDLGPADLHGALVGAANLLTRNFLPPTGADDPGPGRPADFASVTARRDTEWGPVTAVGPPGTIDGVGGAWRTAAGPLGRHEPNFGAER